jgi:mRNA-degrading endonuclease RelE of RelBE toxin-antitoxin system
MYKINFYPKAKTEIKNFDNSIQKQILKKLEKISINPEV